MTFYRGMWQAWQANHKRVSLIPLQCMSGIQWVIIASVSVLARGVQYVHCVMHKCIMVKVGGKRNTRKVCKKACKFYKIRGEICKRRGKRKISWKRGERKWNSENGGKFEICSELLKIRSWKRSNWWNFPRSLKDFSEIGGKSEICPTVSLFLVHTATTPSNAQLRLLLCLRSSRCCCYGRESLDNLRK